MSGIAYQIDWAGFPIYFGIPFLYLCTVKRWSKKDEAYYQYLVKNSRLYPAGAFKAIFWIFWSIMYPVYGGAAYLFWHEAASIGDGAYITGLTFYWVGTFTSFLWMWLFQNHEMNWIARAVCINIVTGITLAGAIGFFVCSINASLGFSIAISAIMGLWLIYALIMTIRMATLGPLPGQATASSKTILPEFSRDTVYEEAMIQGSMGSTAAAGAPVPNPVQMQQQQQLSQFVPPAPKQMYGNSNTTASAAAAKTVFRSGLNFSYKIPSDMPPPAAGFEIVTSSGGNSKIDASQLQVPVAAIMDVHPVVPMVNMSNGSIGNAEKKYK